MAKVKRAVTRSTVRMMERQAPKFGRQRPCSVFGYHNDELASPAVELKGVEAMPCGRIALDPLHYGMSEFAHDGVNASVVDTRDDDAAVAAGTGIPDLTSSQRKDMRLNGISTRLRHSQKNVALPEIRLLASHLLHH